MRDIHYRKNLITNTLRHVRESPRIKPNDKNTIREAHDYLQIRGASDGHIARTIYTLKGIAEMELPNTLKRLDKHDVNLIAKNIIQYAASSRDKYRKSLIIVSKISKKKIPKIPKSQNRKHELPNYLTKSQVLQLMDHLQGEARILAFFMWDSGCRVCEAYNLKIRDIIHDTYGMKVRLTGKTGHRIVRLIEDEQDLQEHIKGRDPSEYVFEISYTAYRRSVTKAGSQLNLEKITPYTLRHSRVTHMAQFLTESQLCALYGWRHGSKMPGVYVHLTGNHLDTALLRMRHHIPAQRQNIPRICAAW